MTIFHYLLLFTNYSWPILASFLHSNDRYIVFEKFYDNAGIYNAVFLNEPSRVFERHRYHSEDKSALYS